MKKFGKPSNNLINHSQWHKNNSGQLERVNSLATLYSKQQIRTECKVCKSPLNEQVDFAIRGISYKTCTNCNHFNGAFDDSNEYTKKIYESDNPETYGKNYINIDLEGFEARSRNVYQPKVEFLFSCLQSQNETPQSLQFLDIGAGAGHLLAALSRLGIPNPKGIEISPVLVSSGKAHLAACAPGAELQKIDNASLAETIRSSHCDVISMIGVLEHLPTPHEVLTGC